MNARTRAHTHTRKIACQRCLQCSILHPLVHSQNPRILVSQKSSQFPSACSWLFFLRKVQHKDLPAVHFWADAHHRFSSLLACPAAFLSRPRQPHDRDLQLRVATPGARLHRANLLLGCARPAAVGALAAGVHATAAAHAYKKVLVASLAPTA